MAALSTALPTLVDVAKISGPDGRELAVAEVLRQTNDMLDMMTSIEANQPTAHVGSIRTGIPLPVFRKYNQGVTPTKATQATVSVGMAMMEDYSEVDKALADLNGNTNRFRANQDKGKLQGFNNKAQQYFTYGNATTEPEAFSGFMQYYSTLNTAVPLYENVIDGLGTGTDNTSILLVVWGGEGGITGIYPKGSKAGLQSNDKGQVTIESANGVAGARMEAYRTHYKWDLGLFLGDWRQAVRIANIDKSNLTPDASGSSANLPNLMYQAMELVNDLNGGNAAFYMSRRTRMFVRQQLSAALKESVLTRDSVGGKMVTSFQDIPMGRVDAMAADETRVVV